MPRAFGALLCSLAFAVQGATIRTTPQPCAGTVHAEAGDLARDAVVRNGEAQLDLTGAKLWRITLASPACWAAPVVSGGEVVEIPVWPQRTVSGELSAEVPSLTLHFASPDGTAGGVPASSTACLLNGRCWTCDVPKVPLDLRLEVPGFAPARRWSVDAADIGKLELHRGASVAGFVARDGGGALGDAEVVLTVDDKAVQHAKPDVRGFFQFTTIPPGTYTIVARRAAGAPARERGIRVVADRETLLRRPLLLTAFAKLHTTINPPVTPAGHSWTVDLKRVDFARNAWVPFARGAATPGGSWERGDLERDTYSLQVIDELGAVYFQRYVDIDADVKEVGITVQTIPLEGRIRLSGDPVHATMTFVSSSANIVVESGDDGLFYGSLPHEGEYELRIQPKVTRFQALRRRVDVRRSPASGVASVDIDLPGGRVKGVVVDSRQKPLADASVSVLRGTSYAGAAFSDESGSFEVAGLEPGSVTVMADHGKNRSTLYTYEASPEPVPLTIVIDEARKVRGRVLSSGGGGIAGAELRYFDGHSRTKP